MGGGGYSTFLIIGEFGDLQMFEKKKKKEQKPSQARMVNVP